MGTRIEKILDIEQMKLIAHRGNVSGPSLLENSIDHINNAIQKGFDVEVDLRFINREWWVGHDHPQYKIETLDIFPKERTWWHCKNFDALQQLSTTDYTYFWHQNDDYTLTSNGYIWTYPEKSTSDRSIIVVLSPLMIDQIPQCYGICSDYVENLSNP